MIPFDTEVAITNASKPAAIPAEISTYTPTPSPTAANLLYPHTSIDYILIVLVVFGLALLAYKVYLYWKRPRKAEEEEPEDRPRLVVLDAEPELPDLGRMILPEQVTAEPATTIEPPITIEQYVAAEPSDVSENEPVPPKEPERPVTRKAPPPPGLRPPAPTPEKKEKVTIPPVYALGALLLVLCAVIFGPNLMNGGSLVPTVAPTATPIVNASTPTAVVVYVTVTPYPNGTFVDPVNNTTFTVTPLPENVTASPRPTPSVTAYPTLSPTVTPDRNNAESVSPLDPVDYDRVVNPEHSTTPGLLTVTGSSYYGSAYAYRGDTYYQKIVYMSNGSVNQVRVRYSAISEDGKTALQDSDRVEYWRMERGDMLARTYGFNVPTTISGKDAPSGVYVIRLSVYKYNLATGKYDEHCASLIQKLTVL